MEKKDNYLITTADTVSTSGIILDTTFCDNVSVYTLEDLIVEKAEFLTKDAIVKLLQNRFSIEYFSLLEEMNKQNYKTKLKQILVM